ncbi:MAG: efflux RND transporter permease subunit, partial [Gammaproteobacteria bacterium]|nr:efflux RND transporter permease subunit [Gammaproteobacteria bacterium]
WLMDFTIDRVSLFALIFSIGILVDDAIVVVENIYRRWLIRGEMDTETSIDAVREVGNPTILATFTVIAALLPMGFVSGMMGPYMAPIPALGSVAMLFSLFAAFIFTPWLVMRLRPTMAYLQKAEKKEHRFNEGMDRLYRRLLLPLIDSPFKGWMFLLSIIVVFFLCCALFYTTSVTAKMLPLDNKPEFNVQINMPEGTALPVTANVVKLLTSELQKIEQVTALQSYVGTASPFNFNGLVRHSYLRDRPWQADIQVQLTHKSERKLSSHDLAVQARALLQPIASRENANIEVVEMPPGPPVLQSVVAEVYGPDAETRRTVADDLTQIFASTDVLTDVDNLIQQPYEIWRFVVDTEKAVRQGVSVDIINRNLEMALGEFVIGDVKEGNVSEPTFIVLQMPLENRANFSQIGNLPIMSSKGFSIPLAELGEFEKDTMDYVIYHKDLRPLEFVTAEVQGRLASPIYGMLEVEEKLKDYVAPDGVELQSEYLGPPVSGTKSGFEWTGEWTVTYETFRDMGMAFGAAIILIYMLVVWEFGNFLVPAIIISPIPLTLIGIIPGHWLFGAEFTATSMIGFIALAGIIVRNSILLVDFSREQIRNGVEPLEAIINSCKARTRPILITAGALMGGAVVILSDPIFKGMAISLFFGVLVATLLTLLIIPLGCVSARQSLIGEGGDGELPMSDHDEEAGILQPEPVRQSLFVGTLAGIGKLFSWLLQLVGIVLQILLSMVGAVSRLFQGASSTPVAAGSTDTAQMNTAADN